MKESEIIKLIGEIGFSDFKLFMRGRTVGISEDGSFDYYPQDFEDFLLMVGK